MAVLLLPLGIELHHASEHHNHNHCDITAEHFDSHEEDCSQLHFLSKVNAIDFGQTYKDPQTVYFKNQLFFPTIEVPSSIVHTTHKRGPPVLL